MSRKNRFEDVMHRFEVGQQEALLRKLWLASGGESSGEEGLRAILRDELTIQLLDKVLKLVDGNGRYIPLKGMKSDTDFVESNRNYRFNQPDISVVSILTRLQNFFIGLTFVSAEEFNNRVAELLEMLRAMKQMKNLLNGVHFPVCLPQFMVQDYGESLESVFLEAVKHSYEDRFPGRTFKNYRAGTLRGKVGIVDESRHGQLIEKMKSGPVVGIYFPDPMQGFSIPADRELIQASPAGFLLTGAIDTTVAMVAKPEVLARDYNTPVMDCAANNWQSAEYSLCFYAYDDELEFGSGHLGAREYYSGGLLFVG
ncbi:MAG: hypothetical protein HY982_00045 [Candidatus Magasanikbacteria bacterium]|nr:hypothetical protein [Candidatus Magasanikbacteria bacterium]